MKSGWKIFSPRRVTQRRQEVDSVSNPPRFRNYRLSGLYCPPKSQVVASEKIFVSQVVQGNPEISPRNNQVVVGLLGLNLVSIENFESPYLLRCSCHNRFKFAESQVLVTLWGFSVAYFVYCNCASQNKHSVCTKYIKKMPNTWRESLRGCKRCENDIFHLHVFLWFVVFCQVLHTDKF